MVSDKSVTHQPGALAVSIRFEVRGGFRPPDYGYSDFYHEFQSALRFAVVSDCQEALPEAAAPSVSIRFEVRGGFRLARSSQSNTGESFNPL